ncbi:GNAT family N-acetyltransferase [Anaerovorax odorimutans]|uniref:GNAT family N-acetyltransferase n=1 Tax=Anaerovorax odorimutans TaxID=109327 RepID=A0ABT1RSQ2_9FIRM|nr:GNAT family N-acetyltransferase [Anaerovorax odorimutans]MCQ4638213.1 GNAT family N-acetyltransferase [Anaerovorax odorimutans]
MKLRRFRADDLQEIARLFSGTISSVNKKDYSQEQIKAWSGRCDRLLQNRQQFMDTYTIVAAEENRIVGYGNIDDTGYLDQLFVHKDYQRKKIATAICDELERHVYTKGIEAITVHASITARTFFEKRGYETISKQEAELDEIKLTNYLMKKDEKKYE